MKKATTTMKKRRKSGSKEGKGGDSPSRLIDARIKELRDWRGETLARVRMLIKQADPEAVEEWKWRVKGVKSMLDSCYGNRAPLRPRRAGDGEWINGVTHGPSLTPNDI